VEATARIVAAPDGRGGTALAVLRGEPPLLPRRTGGAAGGPVEVHLVGGAAGPLGGDRLTLEIEVRAGAALRVRTVAAAVALPGPGPSCGRVVARVGAGGRLDWLPEPVIAASGCRHRVESIVDVAAGGYLTWREEVVLGRHGEPGGEVETRTRVRYDGAPLLSQDLRFAPDDPGSLGPAVLGGARVLGCMLVVDPTWAAARPTPAVTTVDGGTAARMPLAGPALVVTVTAPHLPALRRAVAVLLPSPARTMERGCPERTPPVEDLRGTGLRPA
jgi:urease accessory protein